MIETSVTRSEAVARFLLANAVRTDDGHSFTLTFPAGHASLIEARFCGYTAEELGRGEDLAMVQVLRHLMLRERAGRWPHPEQWLEEGRPC